LFGRRGEGGAGGAAAVEAGLGAIIDLTGADGTQGRGAHGRRGVGGAGGAAAVGTGLSTIIDLAGADGTQGRGAHGIICNGGLGGSPGEGWRVCSHEVGRGGQIPADPLTAGEQERQG